MTLNLRKNLIVLSVVLIVLGISSILGTFSGYFATLVVGIFNLVAVVISIVLIRKIRKTSYYFQMAFVWMWLFLCFLIITVILMLAFVSNLQEVTKIATDICSFIFFLFILMGFINYLRPHLSFQSEKTDRFFSFCYAVCSCVNIVINIIIVRLSAETDCSTLLKIRSFIEILGNTSIIIAALLLLIQITKYDKNETKRCTE